jgi:molybdopterin-dependent oxidoreductase alpha subunit
MWRPSTWASLVPHGFNRQKPFHFSEMAHIAWENRGELPFAWRILRDGVCDGCALGTSGLSDWTIDGVHLCMVRLELMRLNTAPALDTAVLRDVSRLRHETSAGLRDLGRLPDPMIRRVGDAGFNPVSWDEALDTIVRKVRSIEPDRAAFYLTSRGITNEVYYASQKAARLIGTNNVDNSARLCHAASTSAMKAALGHGASSCSYADWLHADLIVFFGSNTPNNQPVTTKYLFHAKRHGAAVAVVNPYREPGLDKYWIPSIAESALFGTRMADSWFDVHTGGDLAFLIGVFKALLDHGWVDEPFVRSRTSGFDEAAAAATAVSWPALEEESGTSAAEMTSFARMLADRPNAIFVWSMGLTQHAHGVQTVRALLNIALARGLFGSPNRGVMPIRGHSGVQGGAEVGCTPSVDAETARRWRDLWGFDVPRQPGLTAVEMVEASAGGKIDLFWIVGGNFLETLPDGSRNRTALSAPGLRIHQDIVLSSSMLVDPSDTVLLLPATTRYESPGGGTETSTERRIIFSPEIPGRRIGSARPEWRVFSEIMDRLRPGTGFDDAPAIRREIADAVPLYRGIETLTQKGDQVQWGGRTLFTARFDTADGFGRFAALAPLGRRPPQGAFYLSTRRGKQFNSMLQRETDPLTGASRDDILMSEQDARAIRVANGEAVRLVSPHGEFHGRVRFAAIKSGNVEVHWPEGMALLPGGQLDPVSLEPDYNTTVTIERSS